MFLVINSSQSRFRPFSSSVLRDVAEEDVSIFLIFERRVEIMSDARRIGFEPVLLEEVCICAVECDSGSKNKKRYTNDLSANSAACDGK